jgi:hypothetical protein
MYRELPLGNYQHKVREDDYCYANHRNGAVCNTCNNISYYYTTQITATSEGVGKAKITGWMKNRSIMGGLCVLNHVCLAKAPPSFGFS